MAPRVFLLCILIVEGFSLVHCTDKSKEQTGLYFIEQPEDVIAVKGEPLLLPCIARSTKNQELKLEWLHNGSSVLTDGRRQVLSNGSLSFSKIVHKKNGYSDQGEYRCVISDGNGFLSSKFILLRISGLRNFTEHPKSQTVKEGSHLRMSCQIDSLPDAIITWEHNDHILPHKSVKYRILSGPGFNGSVIYIFNAGYEDAGKYRCVATNPITQNQRQSKRATLAIKAREKQEPPKFLSYSHTKIVREGDNVQLDCIVEGLPFPTLVWTYRKQNVNNIVQVFNSTSTGHNIVTLESITLQQSGFYTCSASGDSAEMVIAVKVMTHPEFVERPETVTYQAARAVRFRCKVVGNPIPMIVWVKDGFPIKITGRISHNTSVNSSIGLRSSEILVASSLASDAGIYQCVAKNPMGMIWAASRLILNATKPAPRPPEHVSCQTISSTEIAVDWNVSPEMLISGLKAFTIHYHDIDGGEELREAVAPTNRSIIVHSLIPYTNYTFYLRSYSDSASDFSKQVICQTGEEVPQVAPEVRLEGSTPNSLHLSWTPPTKRQARGNVIKYKIQWRVNGSPSTNVHLVNGDVLKYTITDLVPNTEYEVRVIAATTKGWPSINFPWKLFKLPNANISENSPQPNIILKALNSSTIKVTWNIPNDLVARVRGFKIFYRKENDSAQGPISVPANVSEYHITQLDSETLYEVDVLGFTDTIEGERGRSSVRTLSKDDVYRSNDRDRAAELEPPVALGAEPSGRGVISLSWNVPPSSAENIKDYTICYNPVQTTLTASTSSITCFKSSETKVLITNLEPYTLYEFRVRSNGFDNTYSNFSQSVECYTFEDIPSHVIDIKWKPENKTTISVSWKQPKKTNGAILNYTIFYTRNPSQPLSSWSIKVVPGNTFSTYVTNLVPNTEYYMVIRASTSAGLGSYGNPKQVVIPVLIRVPGKKTPKSENDRRNEQYVGIIVGLGIGLTCIIICTLCIVCRRRCVKNNATGEVEHVPGRGTNGTARYAEREMRLDSQESEFFPYLSAQGDRTDGASVEHLDKKGRHPNGFPNGVRMTLLGDGKSQNSTIHKGNINITENPRYDATNTVSPLLGHQHSLTVSSENGFDRDLSDSDVLNHSKVPLLIGKRKFSEAEQVSYLNSEDSESEREGKTKPPTNSSFSQEQSKNQSHPVLEQKEEQLIVDNGLVEEKHMSNSRLKENRVLENPEFRFSDSCDLDKLETKKNGFVLQPKLCNGAADSLL